MASDKLPILSNQEDSCPSLSEESFDLQTECQATNVTASAVVRNDLPPPYSALPRGVSMIKCDVCSAMIDITDKSHKYVVKCSSCNETTAIRTAPPGKRFVRCPCQCLLFVKVESLKISCPRTTCKRVLNLAPLPTNPPPLNAPGDCQVSCAHCHSAFMFNTFTNTLVRCPHCRKISSFGPSYARRRGIMCLVAVVVKLALAFTITYTTLPYAEDNKVLYFVYAYLIFSVVVLSCRAAYYFTRKISKIDSPV